MSHFEEKNAHGKLHVIYEKISKAQVVILRMLQKPYKMHGERPSKYISHLISVIFFSLSLQLFLASETKAFKHL